MDATHREWAAKTHGSTPGANVAMAASELITEAATRHLPQGTRIVWKATDWRDRQMQAQRNDRRGNSTFAIVAAFIAVVGQAVVLFDDFGAGNNLHHSVSARMITAAALSRAGAIEILPKPAAGRSASWTGLESTPLRETRRSREK